MCGCVKVDCKYHILLRCILLHILIIIENYTKDHLVVLKNFIHSIYMYTSIYLDCFVILFYFYFFFSVKCSKCTKDLSEQSLNLSVL